MISSKLYYSDATLQLEINLQNKRRELIAMLDSVEQNDCIVCYHLKCHCKKSTENGKAFAIDTTKKDDPAPPTLEKDYITDEIEAWIKSSKIFAKGTKGLTENEKKILQIKQSLLNNSAAVEAFFKSFKLAPKTSVTLLSNKLTDAFGRAKQSKTDYSYF